MNVVKQDSPIEITEDIQVSLNRLGRDLETHVESGIRIGKELIYLKKITPHGKFGDLVEWAYGLKRSTRENYMNVAEKFGNNPNQLGLSSTVLIELSRPSVPESAREEATEHDKLTVKQSKELIKAHKEVEELKSENLRLKSDKKTPTPANTENLIPILKEMLGDGRIMPAMGLKLSTMDNEGQQAWLTIQVQKQSLENQLNEKTDRIKELESRPEPKAKIIEKEIIPLDTQAKLKDAEKTLAKLKAVERSAKNIRADFNTISGEKHVLEHEISILKDQLKVNDPENVDIAIATDFQEIQELFKNKIIRLKEQQVKHDYQMPIAMAVIEDAISILSAFGDSVNEIGSIEI